MPTADVPSRFSDVARYILHTTDFSPESELAFAHALRLAINNKARLTIMHVSKDKDADWDNFPSVRTTLQNWGLLEQGARRADVSKMGVQIEKIHVPDTSNVVGAVTGYLQKAPVEILVLATQRRKGWATWFNPSTAEQVSRHLSVPTLFVPAGARGCVDLETGQVSMNQILIPVDGPKGVGGAIERGLRALKAFGNADSRLTLLHVGEESDFPEVVLPEGDWTIVKMCRQGKPVEEILKASEELQASLMIMVTEGSEGILDKFRGTTTEQVLHDCHCPLLVIPDSFN